MTRTSPVFLLALVSLLGSACDKQDADRSPPASDNTKVNQRDRGGSITPMDQSNLQADLDVTQKIRKALVADDTLSQDAKNVKVITNGGVVTIRGPVKNEAERASVEAVARRMAGGNRVEVQVEIAP
jgi:hyperosmotically inducible protein